MSQIWPRLTIWDALVYRFLSILLKNRRLFCCCCCFWLCFPACYITKSVLNGAWKSKVKWKCAIVKTEKKKEKKEHKRKEQRWWAGQGRHSVAMFAMLLYMHCQIFHLYKWNNYLNYVSCINYLNNVWTT